MSIPSWSDVPGDIISQIVQHLPLKDLVRIGVICKTWRPIVLEAIRHHQFMNMLWLTLHDPSTSTMRFGPIFSTPQFDQPQSADQTTRSLNEIIASNEVKQLASARVCASRFGWLLLFETNPYSAVMYFYNPFLNVIIDNLPSLPLEVFEYSDMHGSEHVAKATFTDPPTSPDCVIFVVSERRRLRAGNFGDLLRKIINIKTCSLKDGRWSTIYTTDNICAHIGDVVYIDGVLHCLYYTGPFLKMVTCSNVALQNWTVNNYRHFESSPYFGAFGPYWPSTYCVVPPYKSYCFVESTDGNLLLAIRITERDDYFNYPSYWQVYRFDQSKYYEWTRIHSLGNQVLLLVTEPLSAMAVRTEGDAMRFANMIVILKGRQCESFTCTEAGNWRCRGTYCNSGQG